jgi:hypothetical protein
VSAISADNASVNYGKHSSVFQNLKKVNDRIIAANFPAHILHNATKKAVDKMAVDVEVLVVKIFNHFSSSAKHTAALKSVLAFLDNGEEYTELLRHMTMWWLMLRPAIVQVGQKWPAIKSYFLSLGENDCPKFLWEYLKNCEDGNKEGEVSCVLPPYFSFFSNVLLCFQSPIKTPEKDTTIVTQLFHITSTLKGKLEQWNKDKYVGRTKTNMLAKQQRHIL